MARFDVYRVTGDALVLDCQSDLLSHLRSRFVVPLRFGSELALGIDRLTPRFEVAGAQMVMMSHLARAIDCRDILETVASLRAKEYEIKNALDLLIFGI